MSPPFYGYNWVFYADLLAGALAGGLACRLHYASDARLARVWAIAGILLGAAGAVGVFLALYVMNTLFSVGFGAMPPGLMFGLTFAVIVVAALPVALSRRG